MEHNQYIASGKLCLFGEYVVIRGSLALAMPLKFNQSLTVSTISASETQWEASEKGLPWLKLRFNRSFDLLSATNKAIAEQIRTLLLFINNRKPLLEIRNRKFNFNLNFQRNMGLGTSSTLISLLSQWSQIDPYELMYQSFRGSGYDIPAGTQSHPYLYSISKRLIKSVKIPNAIIQHLLFVYLGQKASTQDAINGFENKVTDIFLLEDMNNLVRSAATCKDISTWSLLMQESECLLSHLLDRQTVKNLLFPDYPFAIKSLGAWGGDFIMATFEGEAEEVKTYFKNKGFPKSYLYHEIAK